MTEVKQTYNKAKTESTLGKPKAATKPERIVDVVLNELKVRNGFNEIFPKISDDIMAELHATLTKLVKEVM